EPRDERALLRTQGRAARSERVLVDFAPLAAHLDLAFGKEPLVDVHDDHRDQVLVDLLRVGTVFGPEILEQQFGDRGLRRGAMTREQPFEHAVEGHRMAAGSGVLAVRVAGTSVTVLVLSPAAARTGFVASGFSA